jgi:hypothetical protein
MADEKTLAEAILEESQLLQLTLLKQARIKAEGVFAQTGGQQAGQQAAQQAGHQTYEGISGQAGRTQTETQHDSDVNTVERIKAGVARGSDDNQFQAGAINATVTGIAQVAGYGLSSQMIGASVANNQMFQNTVDLNHKNSNFGRGWGVLGLATVTEGIENLGKDEGDNPALAPK